MNRERLEKRAGGEDRGPWKVLGSSAVYENPWISVREDRVVRPDGEPGIYGVVHYKNLAVGVLAVEDDHLYLVGQYRYPLGAYSWEIPEGGCPEDEEPLEAARRELAEETGLVARDWRLLGEAHLSNSVSDEYGVWFVATGLEAGERRPEGTEELAVRRVPVGEALEMASDGRITDALSLVAIMGYALGRPASRDAAV
ncbi:NUDIX domain-containing protein [Rubrobacter aplysinae]|uniref:NUDIX domain-containing protein n=1 Tax=Rubrobacter aplysinae TaxID=909625 RepID=UPI00064BA50B|nr:NUDIX hydrolase [Rubrobacter aplysinae]